MACDEENGEQGDDDGDDNVEDVFGEFCQSQ